VKKPIIGITMGDPSGIGPELVIKLLSKEEVYRYCYPFVIGDPNVMRETSKMVGGDLHIKIIRDISDAEFLFSHIDVLCPKGMNIQEIRWGKLDPAMGKVAALCLEEAFRMALEKKIDGVVSAPLNKEAFHLSGYPYIDELDYLSEITSSSETFVIGVMGSIWTVAVTSHIPFRDIADMIKKDRVFRYIQLMNQTLKKVGVVDPKIAVVALNVHGGEGGLIGREEIEEIKPAIEEARKLGINAHGPFPADTIFVRAIGGEFNAVVCMYHDQANIARKLHAKRKGATLYMGLPVICGTTAHGTAFDIAGKGIADPGSLEDALKYTAMLSF
jgi:4-hydroxythreonine-4-phosphate dehydrogenase